MLSLSLCLLSLAYLRFLFVTSLLLLLYSFLITRLTAPRCYLFLLYLSPLMFFSFLLFLFLFPASLTFHLFSFMIFSPQYSPRLSRFIFHLHFSTSLLSLVPFPFPFIFRSPLLVSCPLKWAVKATDDWQFKVDRTLPSLLLSLSQCLCGSVCACLCVCRHGGGK